MNTQKHDPKLVSLSLGIYRLLLYVYPSGFRREYGPHMTQVFRDCCLRAFGNDGPSGMLSLWATVSLDLVQSVLSEHIRKGVHMSKGRFIQLSGWSLIFGVTALVLGFAAGWLSNGPYDPYNYYSRPIDRVLETVQVVLFPTALLLVAIGIAGLYARYASAGGHYARLSLGLAALGSLLASMTILPSFMTELEFAWTVMTLGLLALFVGLLLFGLAAVRGSLMKRGNWLPVLAGLYFSAFFLVGWIYELSTGNWLEVNQLIEVTGFLLTGLGLAGVGYVMLSDLREERVLSPA